MLGMNSQLFSFTELVPEGRPDVPGPHPLRKQGGTCFAFVTQDDDIYDDTASVNNIGNGRAPP